ncbi:MAG: hypothetical protein JW870_17315 [Candidatus Delongbacteria bacterium]|nr:hypothetical protein [Candidatus Delongbacteria bacterium]
MFLKKFFSWFLKNLKILIIPIIAIGYGIGDTYGFWDQISGRADAVIGINKLLNGDGYPEAWICYNEKEFKPLFNRIKRNTYNAVLKESFNGHYFYYQIVIDGCLAQKPTVPSTYPQKLFIPSYSYILVIFLEKNDELFDSLATGNEFKNYDGFAEWACRAEEFRIWIQNEKNIERFWVSVFLLSGLSLIISIKKWV